MTSAIGIVGTGSYVPSKVVSNEEVADTLDVDGSWIEERTGIRERRFAHDGEATSDLAGHAAQAALRTAGIAADQVDCIVVATSTPDEPLPGVACRVQARLGATRAAAFDIDAVCSGFLYALEVGRSLLVADRGRNNVLVIGADTYSRILDRSDKRTYPLFGDGAGAVVLGRVPAGDGLIDSELRSDGTLAHYVRVPAGGSRSPISVEQVKNGNHYFKMNGRLVRELVETIFPKMVDDTLTTSGLSVGDIDHLICHQANVRLVEACAEKAGFTEDQVVITGRRFANTAAASIPVAIDQANQQGRLRGGDTVLLLTFGGGMSWGRALLRWSSVCPSPSDSRSGLRPAMHQLVTSRSRCGSVVE